MTRTQEAYERLDEGARGVDNQQPAPQPTAVIPSSTGPKPREIYKDRIFGLGIAECLLGGLSIIFAIITVAIDKRIWRSWSIHIILTYTSQGIWAGAFILIIGVLGICIRTKPSVAMYNANMALSIITAVFTGVALLLSGFASAASFGSDALYTLHVLITLCLLGGFISSIVHSAFCCGGVCVRKYRHPGTVVYIPQVPHHQQIGGIPNLQYVVPAGTGMPSQGYFVVSPMAANANIAAVPPQQTGQQGVANMQAIANTSDAATASPAVTDFPPGYSTLPKQ